jgi:hypothetical protein
MPASGGAASEVEQVTSQTGLPRPALLVIAPLRPMALGLAVGIIAGSWLFVLTVILVLRGGEREGRNLSLLAQFFAGYSVTPLGALVGLGYAFAVGFFVGYSFAACRNATMRAYLFLIRRRAERETMSDILDRLP